MLRKLSLICMCLCCVPALSESANNAKYQIATIVAVYPHSSDDRTDFTARSYDVSL
jgi:hypothetical protein